MFFLFQQELLKNFLLYGFYGFFLYIYIMQTEPICCKVTDKKAFFSVSVILIAYKLYLFTIEVILGWMSKIQC